MKPKRIALVGYDDACFVSFARALEQIGFDTCWVSGRRSAADYLTRTLGMPAHRVLDITAGLDPRAGTLEDCREELSLLESAAGPRIYDIILMDRLLRHQPHAFALRYLRHVQRMLTAFFSENSITLVTSGRDTALQIMAMLVSRRLGIPWVVPTRLRIPRELYGFCEGHEMTDMVRVRPVTDEDRAWAARLVDQFDTASNRPSLKTAARSFADTLRLLPLHARLFCSALSASFSDRGNDYTRNTIPSLIGLFVRRRKNLLLYRLRPPYAAPGHAPFCLYGLHTQPESSIDVAGSYFSDQIALITFIARSLPVTHELYIKVHPTDVDGQPLSFYTRIASIPGVRLIDHAVDSRALIRRASLIFSLTGTMGYEAGILGKPVIMFANVYFNSLPTVHYCDAPPKLPALIEELLQGSPPAEVRGRVIEVLADLKTRMFDGEVNRMYGDTPAELEVQDLKTLQTAYDSLHEVLVERR